MNSASTAQESVGEYDFSITAVDIYSMDTSVHIHHSPNSVLVVEDIVCYSYLSPVPESLSIIISLKTLELY
jgi:hypothetical protein